MRVVVDAKDATGASVHLESDGLLSRALQHEVDHLNGILFVRRMSSLKRELIRRKIRKMLRAGDWGPARRSGFQLLGGEPKMRGKDGEHPLGDMGQLIFLGLFIVVWACDSFHAYSHRGHMSAGLSRKTQRSPFKDREPVHGQKAYRHSPGI